MTLYVHKVEGVAPSGPITVDFNQIASEQGPLWVCFDYWIHTADAGASGGVIGDVTWEDPTGATQQEGGTGITSSGSVTKNQNNKVFSVVRQSGSGPFSFNLTPFGDVGSSLISYVVMLQKEQAHCDFNGNVIYV